MPYEGVLEEIIEMVGEDAEFFGCVAEVEHARTILQRGTSAHRQLALYHAQRKKGVDKLEALKDAVDLLMEETVAGLYYQRALCSTLRPLASATARPSQCEVSQASAQRAPGV